MGKRMERWRYKMKKTFCGHKKVLLTGSLRQRMKDMVLADIKNCEGDGADSFILHIQYLKKEVQCFEAFQEMADSTPYPIMAINYRSENGPGDEERIAVQKEAIRAGFACVDMPADLFDPDSRSSLSVCNKAFAAANPKEISMRPHIIEKQENAIADFHQSGAEVLLSAHVYVELSEEEAISLALEMQSRGADIVKIITACNSPEQALTILETTAALKRTLKVPFLYGCYGPHSKLTRPVSTLFGSMLIFGHHDYAELSNRDKPLLKDMKEFQRIIKWNMFE